MDFLKELFGGGSLTFDQLAAAAQGKGMKVVNAAGGAYVPKADADNLQGQVTTLTGQLGEANKKLEGYDPDWKTKAENDRKELEKQQFDFALERGLAASKPRNAKAVMALIDREKLKFAAGEVIGLDKQLEELKKAEDTAFLFSTEDALSKKTGMSHQNGSGGEATANETINAAFRTAFRN